VVVDARLPYVTDGDGMHTSTDPADGERHVAAYVGMDIAQKVFACFDQSDLKAPLSATVTADPAHTVLANGCGCARPGHDTITVTREGGVPVLRRDGVRPHALTVAAYDASLSLVGTSNVDLDDDQIALPQCTGLVVVPNAGGETFAHLHLDAESWAAVSSGLSRIADSLVRAVRRSRRSSRPCCGTPSAS
jgi:aminopeptidase N